MLTGSFTVKIPNDDWGCASSPFFIVLRHQDFSHNQHRSEELDYIHPECYNEHMIINKTEV
jgi:hypothetical protein